MRITPNEVHLSDAGDFEKIYYMSSKYCKSPEYYGAFCIPHSLFTTVTNEVSQKTLRKCSMHETNHSVSRPTR